MATFFICKKCDCSFKSHSLNSIILTLFVCVIINSPFPFQIVYAAPPPSAACPHFKELAETLLSVIPTYKGMLTLFTEQLFKGLCAGLFLTLFRVPGQGLHLSECSYQWISFFTPLLSVGPTMHHFCVGGAEAFWSTVYAFKPILVLWIGASQAILLYKFKGFVYMFSYTR